MCVGIFPCHLTWKGCTDLKSCCLDKRAKMTLEISTEGEFVPVRAQ